MEEVMHMASGAGTAAANVHRGRGCVQSQANILWGGFRSDMLMIGNLENENTNGKKKKKKSLKLPSPREIHGGHFCHIFFEAFYIVAQEKKKPLSYVM